MQHMESIEDLCFLFSIEGLALDESLFPHFPPKKNDKGLKVLAKFPLDQACIWEG